MSFNVEIKGMDKIRANFEREPEISEPILQDAIKRSAAVLASNTDADTVPWRTGTLARSFNPVEISRLLARWFPRVEYAPSVQFGMPPSPGRYVPAIKKRLIDSSRPGFGTWPGFPGRHYMEKIRDKSTNGINLIFKDALVRITKAISS